MTIDETFGVGLRTPVDDKDDQVPFRFTGKLNKLTVNLKPEPMSAEDQKRWNDAARQVNLAASETNCRGTQRRPSRLRLPGQGPVQIRKHNR